MADQRKLGPKQQAWVDALRSGKFQKAKGAFRMSNCATGHMSYCAMGVATEVVAEIADKSAWVGNLSIHCIAADQLRPRRSVKEFMGLIFRLNDTDDITFSQIADYIEENAFDLFMEPA